MAGGGRRCNPAPGPRGQGEARLELTPAPPGWAQRAPTGSRDTPLEPTPASPPQLLSPRRWRLREKIASPRLRLVPGLSSYTKSETGEDGIKARGGSAGSSNIDAAQTAPEPLMGAQVPAPKSLRMGPAGREGSAPQLTTSVTQVPFSPSIQDPSSAPACPIMPSPGPGEGAVCSSSPQFPILPGLSQGQKREGGSWPVSPPSPLDSVPPAHLLHSKTHHRHTATRWCTCPGKGAQTHQYTFNRAHTPWHKTHTPQTLLLMHTLSCTHRETPQWKPSPQWKPTSIPASAP